MTHARVLFRGQALLRGGALRHAVAGLTGGIALGNVAVQEDHEGSRTAEGKAVAARRYAQAARPGGKRRLREPGRTRDAVLRPNSALVERARGLESRPALPSHG